MIGEGRAVMVTERLETRERVVAVIPARMRSSRFPGKPLVPVGGVPLVEHVRRRALMCPEFDEVLVATCDREIAEVVEGCGGRAVMTSADHQRCTDRVCEALRETEAEIVAVLQGDEPLFLPEVVGRMVAAVRDDPRVVCVNLLSRLSGEDERADPSVVKAVLRPDGDVLYYSRALVPYVREDHPLPVYRQTGLSAFRRGFLLRFSELPPTPLERIESVDFLRILEHGFPVRTLVHEDPLYGIDEPEHVAEIEARLARPPQAQIHERIRG